MLKIKRSRALAAACFFLSSALAAEEIKQTSLRYSLDDVTFESTIVYDATSDAKRPGILMVPNWMGPTEASLEKAREIAGSDYVVMMVDMYGIDTRPANSKEAGAAAGAVRADRDVMRERASIALQRFLAQADTLPLDPDRIAAIGFCFGGGTVLEFARSGADLDAVVSFHGDLKSPTLEPDAAQTRASVLVLHGADDPYVPQADVAAFIAAMRSTDADWQLVQYSGTVHSFTDPSAQSSGAKYDARAASRAFAAMERLFDEIW